MRVKMIDGAAKWTPEISRAKRGDLIIASQTDRNELVGVLRVTRDTTRDPYLHLALLNRLHAKIGLLRKSNARIATIPAFKPGVIRTLYEISEEDAHRLLRAAGQKHLPISRRDRKSEERSFIEGEDRVSKSSVRNPQLRIAAKRKWGLSCSCCGFEFEKFYGSIAKDIAVVHHLELFSGNAKGRKSTVNDVRVICANCHYVLHLMKPPMKISSLKRLVSKRWHRWTQNGIKTRITNHKS